MLRPWYRLAAIVLAVALGCDRGAPPARTPSRVIALAPSSVELLFALGLGKSVVGVGTYCTHPPEVRTLPHLGGMIDPNLEEIVTLAPDLAVLLPSERRLSEHLAQLGIEVLTIESDRLDEVEEAAARLAQRFGIDEAGRVFLDEFRRSLAPASPPAAGRVLLSLERQPGELAEVLSAAPESFLGELLRRTGAENVAAGTGRPFPRLPLEAILTAAPDTIIELAAEDPSAEERARLIADWQRFPSLPAVRAGRITIVAGSHTLVPGPRLPELYRNLLAVLRSVRSGPPP